MSDSKLVNLLQELIRIPSPNPPGDCRDVAQFCQLSLIQAGFDTIMVAPDERAWSVVGRSATTMDPASSTTPTSTPCRWARTPSGATIPLPDV